MKCSVLLDKQRHRIEIFASGQWTMADADDFHAQMVAVRLWADQHYGVPLAILSDLDGLVLHTAEIAERVEKTVDEIRYLTRGKYALVVPSSLTRMQCRRLLSGIDHSFFDTRDDALAWLGWRTESLAA